MKIRRYVTPSRGTIDGGPAIMNRFDHSSQVVLLASHDPRIVALSIIISILAAYAALGLTEQGRDARGKSWMAWLLGAATANAIGTWSMHFTGMLALRLPIPLQFDWRIVLLSLLVGIIGSAAAVVVMGRDNSGWARAIVAGVCVGGVGIAGLHYTAMAAIQQPRMHHYHSPALVVLSIVLAIVISSVAVFCSAGDTRDQRLRKHVGAILSGSANPIMHYAAMAAVAITITPAQRDLSHAVTNVS